MKINKNLVWCFLAVLVLSGCNNDSTYDIDKFKEMYPEHVTKETKEDVTNEDISVTLPEGQNIELIMNSLNIKASGTGQINKYCVWGDYLVYEVVYDDVTNICRASVLGGGDTVIYSLERTEGLIDNLTCYDGKIAWEHMRTENGELIVDVYIYEDGEISKCEALCGDSSYAGLELEQDYLIAYLWEDEKVWVYNLENGEVTIPFETLEFSENNELVQSFEDVFVIISTGKDSTTVSTYDINGEILMEKEIPAYEGSISCNSQICAWRNISDDKIYVYDIDSDNTYILHYEASDYMVSGRWIFMNLSYESVVVYSPEFDGYDWKMDAFDDVSGRFESAMQDQVYTQVLAGGMISEVSINVFEMEMEDNVLQEDIIYGALR